LTMNQELDRYLDTADELWRSGELEDALELVDTCLLLHPDSADALAMRGGLLRDLDRALEAVEALRGALRQDPTLAQAAADLADVLIYDLEDPDSALGSCERGLKWAADPMLRAELHFLAGASLLRIEIFDRALAHLDEALTLDPTRAHAYRERGFCHFEMWDFAAAGRDYQQALELERDASGEPFFYLGILLEREGRFQEAMSAFYRAHEIEPETYPMPQSMSAEQFSAIVEKARRGLPEEVQEGLSRLTIWIHDYPELNAALVQSQNNITPRLLGIYDGTLLRDVDQSWQDLPGVILLFKRNIELYTRDVEEIESEIQTTLLHELHHFLDLQESPS
jgi:tetratricopeptide (TPR) repeat protein